MLMAMSGSSKLIPELKEIDNLLRCGICYDYLKNTLITSCSHNYCSYCIRKFMQYKSQCPTCFKEAAEPQLRNNRLVDQFIVLYEKVCEKIEDLTFDRFQKNSGNFLGGKIEIDSDNTPPQKKKEISDNTPHVTEAPASNIRISVPDMFTPRRKPKKSVPVTAEPVKLVPCPVCNVDIPERNINLHLDHCLAKSKEIPTERVFTEVDRRKPLPKLVYPLLQEKDLRKKLKELGLSTLGDRKTLVNRHQRFIVLYNSECDSLGPRPVSEIVDQVSNEEKLEKKNVGNTLALTNTWLTVDKKSDIKAIEIAQKQYLNENKNCFAALVEAIKKKNQGKESPRKDGPSCSYSKTPKVEEQESSEIKGQRPLKFSDELSSSPEICVIPLEQVGVEQESNLQSSFDMFEVSGSSPFRPSGQKSSLHIQRQLSSPGRPGPSGTLIPSQISPEQSRTDVTAVTPSRVYRRADSVYGNSSLDSFPSPPPSKLEEENSSPPELNCDGIGSPNDKSVAGSPPPTHLCNSLIVCQFSPNLGAKYEPSDHERTPSPMEFDLRQLCPDRASPPVLRNKRRRLMMKPSVAEDVEDDGVGRGGGSVKGADMSTLSHLQDNKLSRVGRRRGRRKK